MIGALLLGNPVSDELSRLEGHDVVVASDGLSYEIRSVAGEGKPLVGIVERAGSQLFLVTANARLELLGPLARPRIAGPGYKVWVIGKVNSGAITAKRIGVLRSPVTDFHTP